MAKLDFPPRPPITDPEEALLFLYRHFGHVIGETYRSETPPIICLEQIRLIANYAQVMTRELFHKLKENES